jgi:uridine kinase
VEIGGLDERQLGSAVEAILTGWRRLGSERSLLVGVTGIDGSGKGYVAGRVVTALAGHGVRTAGINIDGWLNLPRVRFSPENPAEHFYHHALRLDEMFERLVLPLARRRSHRLEFDFAEETATEYRKHTCEFRDVDVVVLEGIFLLKAAYRDHFDLAFWVDCTFETALERAIERGQEGLPPEETIRAYHTIYFPAERIHLARDDPRAAATAIITNDWRLARAPASP